MDIPTIYDLKDTITREYPRIELSYETSKFYNDTVLIHDNDSFKVTFSIRETEITEHRPYGYSVSFNYDEKNKTAGGGFGDKDIETFIERLKRLGERYLEFNDYEQLSLF